MQETNHGWWSVFQSSFLLASDDRSVWRDLFAEDGFGSAGVRFAAKRGDPESYASSNCIYTSGDFESEEYILSKHAEYP
ncbi:hypothetical protein Tco_0643409 [Tanacetum coccineum]